MKRKEKLETSIFAHILVHSIVDALLRYLVLEHDKLLKSVFPVPEHSKHSFFYHQ